MNYRFYVIFKNQKLRVLDGQPVSPVELKRHDPFHPRPPPLPPLILPLSVQENVIEPPILEAPEQFLSPTDVPLFPPSSSSLSHPPTERRHGLPGLHGGRADHDEVAGSPQAALEALLLPPRRAPSHVLQRQTGPSPPPSHPHAIPVFQEEHGQPPRHYPPGRVSDLSGPPRPDAGCGRGPLPLHHPQAATRLHQDLLLPHQVRPPSVLILILTPQGRGSAQGLDECLYHSAG